LLQAEELGRGIAYFGWVAFFLAVNNGMVLMPGEKAWQPLSAQRGARALKEEDYILDPHGDWVQKDEAPVEPTENERSRPRMFLIRFLNSRSISKKTVGTNVLYNGKWQNTEQDDFDYGQFPDEEELSNLSQDKFLPLNEFQVDVSSPCPHHDG